MLTGKDMGAHQRLHNLLEGPVEPLSRRRGVVQREKQLREEGGERQPRDDAQRLPDEAAPQLGNQDGHLRVRGSEG